MGRAGVGPGGRGSRDRGSAVGPGDGSMGDRVSAVGPGDRVSRVGPGERGSAVAEFTMVAGLLVILVLALVQLTFALWVRTVLIDAAAEGARAAALADGDPSAATDRTSALVTSTLGEGYCADVSISTTPGPSFDTVVVEVTSDLPVIGLLGPAGSLTVTGRAVMEP